MTATTDIQAQIMKTLRLQLDFLADPLWRDIWDVDRNEGVTGIPAVDNDDKLSELDSEIQSLYSSYYEFDSHGQACWFDKDRQKADKDKMLALLDSLNTRLSEVNDGSFRVEDEITPYYSGL